MKTKQLKFIYEDIEMIHDALNLEMPKHEDALPGAITRKEETKLIETELIWKKDGTKPAIIYVGKQGYYHDEGELVKVTKDRGYENNHHHNMNDYILTEINGVVYPIDWKLSNLITFLSENGIRTLGSDQGDEYYEAVININAEDMDKFTELIMSTVEGQRVSFRYNHPVTVHIMSKEDTQEELKTKRLLDEKYDEKCKTEEE